MMNTNIFLFWGNIYSCFDSVSVSGFISNLTDETMKSLAHRLKNLQVLDIRYSRTVPVPYMVSPSGFNIFPLGTAD